MCPNADAYLSEQISLPRFADLTDNQVDGVVEEIRKFFGA